MKIKKLNLLLSAILMLSIIFEGCEKQEMVTENDDFAENIISSEDLSNFKQEIVYYIDNEEVFTDLKNYPNDLMIVERDITDYENEKIITERYGFTSEEGYINFGIKNNYPLKEELEFVKQMRNYIETNNVEEYFAEN